MEHPVVMWAVCHAVMIKKKINK